MCARVFVFACAVMTFGRWLRPQTHLTQAAMPVFTRGNYGQLGLRRMASVVPRHVAPKSADSAASAALVCGRVQDWLQQQSDQYRCMHVPRPRSWGDIQQHVDRMASALGREGSLEEVVNLSCGGASEQFLAAEFSKCAQRLAGRAIDSGLPELLAQQMKSDVEEICMVVAKMLPRSDKLMVKLEVMGENVCSRWHQDHYVARAIITYNGWGTQYVHHDNVDFWELENCGNSDCIILDRAKVRAATAGDVLFMKGKLFPGAVHGLVHKSPQIRYNADGVVMNRLLLKVDVP